MNYRKKIKDLWIKNAKHLYWGDDFDSRYLVVEYLKDLKGKKILDLGCSAAILHTFIDPSNSVVGIDLDEEALEIAKKLNKDKGFKYIKGDVRDDSLYPGKYDVIIFLAMLELFHPKGKFKLGDPVEMLKKMKEHLNDNGIIILTTPNGNNSYYKNKAKWKLEEVESFIKKAGLKVRKRILWNPISIHLTKLSFIPFMFELLRFLSEKLNSKNSVSMFYVLEK